MNPIYRFFLGYSGNLAGQAWPDELLGKGMLPGGSFINAPHNYTSGKITLPRGADLVKLIRLDGTYPMSVSAYGSGGEVLSYVAELRTADGYNAVFNVPAGTAYIRYGVQNTAKETLDVRAGRYASPVYKSDLAVEYAQETGELFYRPKLSGQLTFTGCDYADIAAADFDTTFMLDLDISTDGGRTWRAVLEGQFHKTDCEFDYADSRATAEIETRDRYSKLLDGLETEFRLTKLPIAVRRLVMQKRPLVQLYSPGDSVVACFLSGMYWEQDATATDDAEALGNYHFDCPNVFMEIGINFISGGGYEDAYGTYYGNVPNPYGTRWSAQAHNADGSYYVELSAEYMDSSIDPRWAYAFALYKSDGTLVTSDLVPLVTDFAKPGADFNTDYSNSFRYSYHSFGVYARVLCDVDSIDGKTTYPVPSDDIVADNKHYRYAIGYGIHDVYISSNFSDEPTEWGMNDAGKYFMPPYVPGIDFLPVAQSTWGDYSLWRSPVWDNVFEQEGRKDYVLKDAYLVADCIAALLKEIDPSVTHAATAEYSRFFYGESTDGGKLQQLLLTQKTNITNGEYTQPAQNTPITLKTLLDMYKNVFKCYWYVEDGKLKIEQVEFFRNGGSYDGTGAVGYDLAKLALPRNGKSWAYGMEAYKFDKPDMAERYVFSWMDEVSEPFEGMPLEVLSPYVSKGKKEEINISNFTSDIDFMLLDPEAISDDGYALFFAVPGEAVDTSGGILDYVVTSGTDGITEPRLPVRSVFRGQQAALDVSATGGGTAAVLFFDGGGSLIGGSLPSFVADGTRRQLQLEIPQEAASMAFMAMGAVNASVFGLYCHGLPQLPYVRVVMDGVEHDLQNGLLSFAHLQAAYWRYDMPAPRLKINGSETTALSIERKKTQAATYPAQLPYDPLLLVRTPVGDGQVKEASISLSSLTAKTTLKYDTE